MVLPRHCHWRTGSGIWFNMGKMMAFHEHSDAVKKFPGGKTATCKTGDEAMSNAAAKAGYESIQFLGHIDSGTNNACCAQVGGAGANTPCRVEIVAVKLNGGFACTDNAAGAQLRAGWQGFCACACTREGAGRIPELQGDTPACPKPPDSGKCAAEMRRQLPATDHTLNL